MSFNPGCFLNHRPDVFSRDEIIQPTYLRSQFGYDDSDKECELMDQFLGIQIVVDPLVCVTDNLICGLVERRVFDVPV
jgi:hypothetical protein